MREAPYLRIGQHESRKREKIQYVSPASPEDESGYEEDEEIAIGRQRQAGNEHPKRNGREEADRREDGSAAIDVWPRWTPAVAALVAMGFAVLMRFPFWGTPLTSDEGGYAEVARLWVPEYGSASPPAGAEI